MEKAAKKPKKTNGYKLPEPLPPGLILEDLTKKKWKLGPSIGKGGFGEIYTAQEHPTTSKNNYPYVVKIEPHSNGPLFVEMHFYMRIAKPDLIESFRKEKKLKSLGMPTYMGSGRHEYNNETYRFVVTEKFGMDICKLFEDNNKKFPPETVFKLGVQILDVLEYIHSKGYIHADIKGANILLGLNSEATTQVYLVDFGLCTRYSTTDKPDPKKAHNGTLQYVSRDGHLGIESRRSDLEILGYNLVEWLGCTLPWDGKKLTPVAVQQSKEKHMKNLPEFFASCFGKDKPPSAIVDYMKYIATLKFEVDPDYKKLRNILIRGIEAAGSSLQSPFKLQPTKSPGKRKLPLKVVSPSPKKVPPKKNAAKTEPKRTLRRPKKSDPEEVLDQNDSTAGFNEAMLAIRNKMKSKKKNDKKVIVSKRPLRSRSKPDDSISESESKRVSPRRKRT